MAVGVEVDAHVVAADGAGVDRHPPGPVLHALALRAEAGGGQALAQEARRPLAGPGAAPGPAPAIAAWVPPSAAAARVAQRQRRGAAGDRDPLAVAEGVELAAFLGRAASAAVRWITAGLMKAAGVIGAITLALGRRSAGAIAIGLTLRTRLGQVGVGDQGRRVGDRRRRPRRRRISARLCRVPPEIDVGRA